MKTYQYFLEEDESLSGWYICKDGLPTCGPWASKEEAIGWDKRFTSNNQ
jgi:hypothetical protein